VSQWAELSQSLLEQVRELKEEREVLARRNHHLLDTLRAHNIYYDNDP
jgi:hypothetical protein